MAASWIVVSRCHGSHRTADTWTADKVHSRAIAMRTTSSEVFIQLDRSRPRGLRAQVEAGLRDAIRAGRLAPGTGALEPGPGERPRRHPGVVVAAYDQLPPRATCSPARSGTWSTTLRQDAARHRPASAADDEHAVISTSARGARPRPVPPCGVVAGDPGGAAAMPDADSATSTPRPAPAPRPVADYLGRVRGWPPARAGRHGGGFGHGFASPCEALRVRGHPASPWRNPATSAPATCPGRRPVRPVPVDAEGIGSTNSPPRPRGVVVVTPAHQTPREPCCRPTVDRLVGGRGTSTATSSRTTTTPSTATTATRWARCRGSPPNGWSTAARRRRPSPPACGWAGSSVPPDLVAAGSPA